MILHLFLFGGGAGTVVSDPMSHELGHGSDTTVPAPM